MKLDDASINVKRAPTINHLDACDIRSHFLWLKAAIESS